VIPVHGNVLGIAMIVVSAAVAGAGSLLLRLGDAVVMGFVGGTLILMDLGVRLLRRREPGWLTRSHLGGYLYIAPIWVVGLVVIAVNAINLFLQ